MLFAHENTFLWEIRMRVELVVQVGFARRFGYGVTHHRSDEITTACSRLKPTFFLRFR